MDRTRDVTGGHFGVSFFVNVLGGHQSARTLHFLDTLFLALFLVLHILMVCVAGFRIRMRGLITGKSVEKS